MGQETYTETPLAEICLGKPTEDFLLESEKQVEDKQSII